MLATCSSGRDDVTRSGKPLAALMPLAVCFLSCPHSVDPPGAVGYEGTMNIGKRLRELREAHGFTQRDIEQRTGLARTYISRIENGYTVPTIRTLEKLARGLAVPLYEFFYGDESSFANLTPSQWVRIQELIASNPA